MSSDERIRRSGVRIPMLILGAAITLIYFGLGGYLLLDPTFLPQIPTEFRNIFAVLLLVYGFYRGWRTYADYF